MSNENLRTALQDMVSAFNPYAWGSADNKKDALDSAMKALAEDDAEPVVKKDTTEFEVIISTYGRTVSYCDQLLSEYQIEDMPKVVHQEFSRLQDVRIQLIQQLVEMYSKG